MQTWFDELTELWTANSVVLQALLQVRGVRRFGLSFQTVFKVYDSLVSFRYWCKESWSNEKSSWRRSPIALPQLRRKKWRIPSWNAPVEQMSVRKLLPPAQLPMVSNSRDLLAAKPTVILCSLHSLWIEHLHLDQCLFYKKAKENEWGRGGGGGKW